jgi:hypothetical protein
MKNSVLEALGGVSTIFSVIMLAELTVIYWLTLVG